MEQKKDRSHIILFINGQKNIIRPEDAFLPLAQFLRYRFQLPGTKIVCAEGDCGACTILVARWKGLDWADYEIINSCIAPVYLFDLASIVTVEGLEDQEGLNQAQKQMREFHGGQCGYCTPGIVCSLSGLCEKNFREQIVIDEKRARNFLTGNLCRCTGYEPILNAAQNIEIKKWTPLRNKIKMTPFKEEAIALYNDVIILSTQNKIAHLPKLTNQVLEIKNQNREARIVAGATDLGVIHNKGRFFLDNVISLYRVDDLPEHSRSSDRIFIPAKMSLTEFEAVCRSDFPELGQLLHIFASPQIKNQGTLLGNIINGSPIGDTLPALLVLDSEIELRSHRGIRRVSLNQFYKGYKMIDLAPDEIATGIEIPRLSSEWTSQFYKVSVRKDLDISAVTFAGAVKMRSKKILEARFALGGVGPTVVRLPSVEKEILRKDFSEQTFKAAGISARSLVTPISDIRASDDYRSKIVINLFQKFFHEINVLEQVCQ